MDIACFSSPVEAQMTLEALLTRMDSFLFDFPSGTPHPAAFTEFPFADPLSPHSDNLPAVSTSPSAKSVDRTIAVQDLVADSPCSGVDTKDKAATASSPRPLRQRQMPVEAMREMVFSIAAMQPIRIDPDSIKPPKRRNVRISKEPQSVAARHRRERISEKIRILQQLVPGGTKMDTASMLEEAVHYVKFLKCQVQSLEKAAAGGSSALAGWPSAASPAGGCDP